MFKNYLKSIDCFANVLLPLLLGSLIYKLTNENPAVSVIRNYLPDGLWAYAFLSSLLIIWKRVLNIAWLLGACFCATFFEVLQAWQVVGGTADWLDVVTYFLFFAIAVIINKYVHTIRLIKYNEP